METMRTQIGRSPMQRLCRVVLAVWSIALGTWAGDVEAFAVRAQVSVIACPGPLTDPSLCQSVSKGTLNASNPEPTFVSVETSLVHAFGTGDARARAELSDGGLGISARVDRNDAFPSTQMGSGAIALLSDTIFLHGFQSLVDGVTVRIPFRLTGSLFQGLDGTFGGVGYSIEISSPSGPLVTIRRALTDAPFSEYVEFVVPRFEFDGSDGRFFLTAQLGISAFNQVTADFFGSATLGLELPPGVTFTSESGVFLTAQQPSVPAANAGADQTVNEGAGVTLDGSASSDPEGDALAYTWTQTAGPPVTLALADPARPTFAAPPVPRDGATLTFQLVVSDGQQASAPAFVNVTVANVNHAPSADAGPDQVVNEGSPVTLDGSASFDPDGDSFSYVWTQTGGPSVALADATTAQPSFVAPSISQTGALLTFALTVNDGLDSAGDSVSVLVENVNHPPTADAGGDQTTNEGATVTLDGTASSDPDADPLTYAWTQLSGPAVTLSGSTSATPTFVAPPVTAGGATLAFRLLVSDGLGGSASDEVSALVQDVNDPPACHRARAHPRMLWPPNHKLVPVTITGHRWGHSHRMTTTVTHVTQDEPVNGLGDGDTGPDAVIHGSKVLLRAERSSSGNGRVYRLHFTATKHSGESCTGSADVWVPKSLKPGLPVIDDGQLYDSTQR